MIVELKDNPARLVLWCGDGGEVTDEKLANCGSFDDPFGVGRERRGGVLLGSTSDCTRPFRDRGHPAVPSEVYGSTSESWKGYGSARCH